MFILSICKNVVNQNIEESFNKNLNLKKDNIINIIFYSFVIGVPLHIGS